MHMTQHAQIRMQQRGIPRVAVDQTFAYGRAVRARGATHIVMGRKEIARAQSDGLDFHRLEGITLVMVDGVLVTLYRNRDFSHLRGRRPRRRAHRARILLSTRPF